MYKTHGFCILPATNTGPTHNVPVKRGNQFSLSLDDQKGYFLETATFTRNHTLWLDSSEQTPHYVCWVAIVLWAWGKDSYTMTCPENLEKYIFNQTYFGFISRLCQGLRTIVEQMPLSHAARTSSLPSQGLIRGNWRAVSVWDCSYAAMKQWWDMTIYVSQGSILQSDSFTKHKLQHVIIKNFKKWTTEH